METEEQYIKLPYALMAAKGYVNQETGEAIKMSQGAKFIYLYLKARNQFFVVQRGGEHFEAQSTIAEAVGMDLRRTAEIILEFIKNGVVYAEKEACSNGRRWHYRRVNNLLLWKGKDKTPLTKAKKTGEQEVGELLPVEDVPVWLWDDDLNGGEY
jgi:hypothetical protein